MKKYTQPKVTVFLNQSDDVLTISSLAVGFGDSQTYDENTFIFKIL